MFDLSSPAPVKLLVAAFWNDQKAWQQALTRMTELWGDTDRTGAIRNFIASRYYESEMGPNLTRQLHSFEQLVPTDEIADLKLQTNRIEKDLCCNKKRTVNLDIGYMDLHKLVLASTKEGPHKIYIGRGVWADLILLYSKKRFHALPWTFPDFASCTYDEFLLKVRQQYKKQLRYR